MSFGRRGPELATAGAETDADAVETADAVVTTGAEARPGGIAADTVDALARGSATAVGGGVAEITAGRGVSLDADVADEAASDPEDDAEPSEDRRRA